MQNIIDMAIVPTQLLQYADGGNSQGFSTMYDMKLLNTYKRTADGKIEDMPKTATVANDSSVEIGQYSVIDSLAYSNGLCF